MISKEFIETSFPYSAKICSPLAGHVLQLDGVRPLAGLHLVHLLVLTEERVPVSSNKSKFQ